MRQVSGLRARWFAVVAAGVLAVGAWLVVVDSAEARYATGGSGRWRSLVNWMEWPGDGSGRISNGAQASTTQQFGGHTLRTTCTLTNIRADDGAGDIYRYRSGSWSGDALDDLYNIGGTGTNNQLVAGISNGTSPRNPGTMSFHVDCVATLDGEQIPLSGLVFADAEQNNYQPNGQQEWIRATPDDPSGVTWRLLERARTAGCGTGTWLTRGQADESMRMQSTATQCSGTPGGPIALTYMEHASSATFDVNSSNGAVSALALGTVSFIDFGDAPESYGVAAALSDGVIQGGELAYGNTQAFNAGVQEAAMGQPTPRLGARVDPDSTQLFSADALGDDRAGVDDEDAVTFPATVEATRGQPITSPPIECHGPGDVVAWFDWNRNGRFDESERSTTEPCGTDGSVAVTWQVPADAAVGTGTTFVRVRIADPSEEIGPVGPTLTGEVEDYRVSVRVVQGPVAADDRSEGNEIGAPVTVAVLANDEGDLDPSSLRLTDPAGDPVTELVVPGEGTWSVGDDGTITFTPEPGFEGNPTPVDYTVEDADGLRTGASVTVTYAPEATDDESRDNPRGSTVRIDPLANDKGDLDPSTVRLTDPAGDPVTELVVPGEGTWSVGDDGTITFAPEPGFEGDPTPVGYTVEDRAGQEVGAKITVTYEPGPTAHPDQTSGAQGAPQSVDPLANDERGPRDAALDPSSLTLLDDEGNPVSSLTVPGEGTFTVSDGKLVFTPEPGFVGEATPVRYRVADANGATAESTYTPMVTPVAQPDTSSGPQGVPQSVDPLANDGADGVELDPSTLTLVDAGGNPVSSLTVPGEGTYTVSDGKLVFTPEPQFTGEATPVRYRVEDSEGNAVESTYTPTVTPVRPSANPDTTSGPQGVPQSVDPLANDEAGDDAVPLDPESLTLLDADGNVVSSVTVPGEGVYTVSDGKLVFTPEPQFTGEATPVRYQVADVNGTTAESTYTPTITPVAPKANPDTTSGPQGVPQSVDPLVNDVAGDDAVPLDPESLTLLDAAGNPVESVTVPGEGVYTVSDGKLVFTPEPQFTGTATPVDYQVADVNGTTARSTYTPTVEPVSPKANPDTTSGPEGQPQSIDPLANDEAGDDAVPLDPDSLTLLDEDGNPVDSVTVPGEGVYTVSDGKLVFTPEPDFVGEATPVRYQVADVNGTTADSTYTPTVTPVAQPDTSSGPQGVPQSVDPLANDGADGVELDPSTLTLVDADGNPVSSLTVPGEGTYTVSDGKMVFTPEPQFTGEATPVRYRVEDSEGNAVESTYTPTVTAVRPSANPDTTSGPQGVPQSVDPLANDEAGDDAVLLDPESLTLLDADGNAVDSVTVPGEGVYTVSDGKLVFTPEPGFVGEATPVRYQVADVNGTTAESTYTPTITPVAPKANPDTTSGPQGVPQSVDPLVNDVAGDDAVPLDPESLTLLDAEGNPVESVTVPGEGVYTVSDGKLVFTPEPQFTGTATPVDYQVADVNGTTARSTYTPTVEPVSPKANPDTTSGPQGQPQSIEPLANDEAGDDAVPLDPDSLTLLDDNGDPTDSVTVPGEGTYTVDDGKIVFTPEPGFTGEATPVRYQVADVNDTTAESTYTPTVTPVAQPDTTSGPQGVPQSVDPLANDGADGVELDPSTLTLVDADGNPTDIVTVPGEGTYTVEDGKLVFTPEPDFTGTATPVRYRVDDTEGNTVESTYTPTLTPVTPTANPDQTSGPQGRPQSIDPLANDKAGDPAVPLDPPSLTLLDGNGDPVDSVTVPGEGVYTVEAGKIVFTPEPDFTGTATPVDYQVADVNGTTARSTYTPTVAPDRPGIALDKTTGRYTDKAPRGGSAGDTLVYRFRVTNTGNTVLHDIAVHDPMLGGPVACGSGPLAPGTSRDCVDVTYTLRSGDAGTSLRNTAEVAGQSPEGRTTSAADTVIYEVPPASGPTPAPAPAPGAVDGVAGGSGALPATGSAVSPGYVGAGLAALLGGLALAWYGRRQHRPRRRG